MKEGEECVWTLRKTSVLVLRLLVRYTKFGKMSGYLIMGRLIIL